MFNLNKEETRNNMKKKPASSILVAIRFYTYFFSVFIAVCLFFLSVAAPRAKFMDSEFIDVLARCIFWLWLVFAYWSLFTALTSQIRGSGRYFLELERNTSSFAILLVNAVGFGLAIWYFTRGAFHVFVPGLVEVIVSLIAILNGLIYAIFLFLRYFWLTESTQMLIGRHH